MSEFRLRELKDALDCWNVICKQKKERLRSHQLELVELRRQRVRPHDECVLLLKFCVTRRQEIAQGQEAIRCCEERIQRLNTELSRSYPGAAAT